MTQASMNDQSNSLLFSVWLSEGAEAVAINIKTVQQWCQAALVIQVRQ